MTVPAPAPLNSDHAAARTVGLWKVYGEGDTQVVALSDVPVAFARGRYTAIMGPSGSGKSTPCIAWRRSTPPQRARCSSATPN